MHADLSPPSMILLSFLLLFSKAHCRTKVFDVTEHGASTKRSDNKDAFSAAWRSACDYEGKATFLVPKGTFVLSTVAFNGPCRDGLSPRVEIHGTLRAVGEELDSDRWILFEGLKGLSVVGRGGTLDGQGAHAWPLNTCHYNSSCQAFPTALCFYGVEDTTISGLHLRDGKSFHMKIHKSSRVKVRDLEITAPEHSPNTDGIHVGHSTDVDLSHLVISTGDDCISVGPGTVNLSISMVTCGPGHGISVGSLGKYPNEDDVQGIHVKDCIITNTTNGARIKTWPGLLSSRVSRLTFENVIMDNVTNPIIIDQKYCPGRNNCTTVPSHVMISDVKYRRISGTSTREVAVNFVCSEAMPCENISLEDISLQCVDGSRRCTASTTTTCSNVEGSFSGLQIPPPCLLLQRVEHRSDGTAALPSTPHLPSSAPLPSPAPAPDLEPLRPVLAPALAPTFEPLHPPAPAPHSFKKWFLLFRRLIIR